MSNKPAIAKRNMPRKPNTYELEIRMGKLDAELIDAAMKESCPVCGNSYASIFDSLIGCQCGTILYMIGISETHVARVKITNYKYREFIDMKECRSTTKETGE